MIDFHTYERVKLEDVADFERAKSGKVYQAGSTTIQMSATRGQLEFLHSASVVEAKYAVILPIAGIDPFYFYCAMQKNIDEFMHRYVAGLNIQEADLASFPIEVHNADTQAAVVAIMRGLDAKAAEAEHELGVLRDFKQTMLDKMMV